jgi:hypothetical protein
MVVSVDFYEAVFVAQSRDFLIGSDCFPFFPAGDVQKLNGEFRQLPIRNIAPKYRWKSLETVVSGRKPFILETTN